jgi:hypothetical protein
MLFDHACIGVAEISGDDHQGHAVHDCMACPRIFADRGHIARIEFRSIIRENFL